MSWALKMHVQFLYSTYPNPWVLGCLTAATPATASLKLPKEDRGNQHKKNVSVKQSRLGGLLAGSLLMLEQEEKPRKCCDWVSPSRCQYLFQSLGSDCCDGSCSSCSSMEGGQPWRSSLGSPCLRLLRDAQVSVEQALLQAAWFPDLSGEEGKEKANNSYTLWDSLLLFWKRKCRTESESQGKWVRCFMCFWFKACSSLPAWFHLVPVGVSLDQSLFWKKGVQEVCRKFLYKRKSCITGKLLHHTLWGMKSGWRSAMQGSVGMWHILLGKGRGFKYLVFIKKIPT